MFYLLFLNFFQFLDVFIVSSCHIMPSCTNMNAILFPYCFIGLFFIFMFCTLFGFKCIFPILFISYHILILYDLEALIDIGFSLEIFPLILRVENYSTQHLFYIETHINKTIIPPASKPILHLSHRIILAWPKISAHQSFQKQRQRGSITQMDYWMDI